MSMDENLRRALIANSADVDTTRQGIERLINYHESERAVHDSAIATLRKSLSHAAFVQDAHRAELQILQQREQNNDPA